MISVDVWSDVACPWCYLGKHRLEKAIEASGAEVTVTWHSFQLDPTIPHGEHTPHAEALGKKFNAPPEQIAQMNQRLVDLGAAEGLEYRFDLYIQANTRDAHRVIHFAQERGLGNQMKDRLMKAQFTEGAIVDDADVLVGLAAEVGLDADEVRAMLATEQYDDAVQADIAEAAALGATGVPFFVFDRAFAVSGAQPVATFEEALRRSSEKRASVG
ncbi:DsbA family oxidoreductase [Demequina sp. TTPB684]|uniref:DsbA family oxidoreductase n=1 Tax=unclassified Demequina TaxID=2620311 RepID=UPI001CF34500|nr:DsbA family oxidoreductase [Demequina sp. TMPB413]MCB2413965.1 DsbA family oxidoreductase [Demequina sp. TTPB684]UPU88682.1 DsbA family oxidoreductase [Demequina sp. TMPB413]